MESLLCLVKTTASEGSKTTCSVFMLLDPMEIVGKVLTHVRVEERIGKWRVESYAKELVLERVEGEAEVEPCDAFYVELVQTAPPPSIRTQFEQALVFSGKNWKLAAEKKWKDKIVNVAGFEEVGETMLRGKPYRILKGPDGFAAVRSSEPPARTETESLPPES